MERPVTFSENSSSRTVTSVASEKSSDFAYSNPTIASAGALDSRSTTPMNTAVVAVALTSDTDTVILSSFGPSSFLSQLERNPPVTSRMAAAAILPRYVSNRFISYNYCYLKSKCKFSDSKMQIIMRIFMRKVF